MKRAAYACLVLTATLLALYLSACRPSRPASDERPNAALVPPPARLDSTANVADASAAKPGILSGIGRVFFTPAGTARRQAVRLARAGVPRKLGKGAVYAPKATEVVAAYKPRAAVINADPGSIVTAIGKNKAPAATAPDAVATETTIKPGFPWGKLVLGLGGVGLLAVLFATPVGPWLLLAFKRNNNNQA